MKKSILPLLLALVMLLSLFAGCTTAQPTESQETATPATSEGETTQEREVIDVTMLNRVNADVSFEDNPIYEYILEEFGINLIIEAPPIANYVERQQILMASGDYPDIMYIFTFDQNYEDWASDGILRDLTGKFEGYDNLLANLSTPNYESATSVTTGNLHAIPRPHPQNELGYIVNQTWLDQFELDMPRTTDDLLEFAELVKTEDPDGNGQDDTFLISPVTLWNQGYLIGAFLPTFEMGTPDPIDGEYKIRQKMTGYMPYLDFMRGLYEDGYLDPEFVVNEGYDDRTKNQSDRIAMTNAQQNTALEYQDVLADSLETFSFCPPIVMEGDDKAKFYTGATTWGGFAITDKVDDEKLERILELFDWANSPEGFTIMQVGFEGTHYESYDIETRALVRTEEQSALAKSQFSGYTSLANALDGRHGWVADTEEKIDYYMASREVFYENVEEVVVSQLKAPLLGAWKSENPDLWTALTNNEILYVTGDMTREDFVSFLENDYFPAIEEAEAEYIEIMSNK